MSTAVKTLKNRGTTDLTNGPIIRTLVLFFLPILAGTLFQQLYNTVDALVVSRFVGTNALAAVGGSPAVVINLVVGFIIALTSGCGVVVSQVFGAKDYSGVKDAVKTSFIFCMFFGFVVGIIVYLFTPNILQLLDTPIDTMNDAIIYQRIYFSGYVFLTIYNVGAAIIRAVGDSKYPFICLFVSCGANIVLDLLFVIVFDMGVSGVAIATVIAQIISAGMVILKLIFSKSCCSLRSGGAKFRKDLIAKMLKIGLPSALQSSMYGISNIIVQFGVNMLGTATVASWSMCGKIDGVYWATSSAFGTALTSFIGQNYGAKKYDRIKKCAKQSMILFTIITVILSAVILVSTKTLLSLLTEDQEVINLTNYMLYFFVPLYVIWTAIEVYSAILRAVGDTLVPFIILLISICIYRMIWVYTAFMAVTELYMLCLCYPISWGISAIAMFIYYRIREKNILHLQKEKSE